MATAPAATRFISAAGEEEEEAAVPVSAGRPEKYAMTPSAVSLEDGMTPRSDEGRPAKRARQDMGGDVTTLAPCYDQVILSTWTTKVKGKNSFGSPIIMVLGSQGPPMVQLSLPTETRCQFPFALDLEPVNPAQVPSFLSGKSSDKLTEGLDFQINLTAGQASFLEKVDAWVQEQAVLNSKEWFGRVYSATEIASMYTPCLKKDKEEKYAPKFKGKLVLSGPHDLLTEVHFYRAGAKGEPEVGAGWDFVKERLGGSNWSGNEGRAVVEIRRIWIVGKKFGVACSFKILRVVEKQRRSIGLSFQETDL